MTPMSPDRTQTVSTVNSADTNDLRQHGKSMRQRNMRRTGEDSNLRTAFTVTRFPGRNQRASQCASSFHFNTLAEHTSAPCAPKRARNIAGIVSQSYPTILRGARWVFARLVLWCGWPRCPDCRGPADLYEGRCVPCFRARLFGPAVALLAMLSLAGCARHPTAQTFPTACPDGWTFLYTDRVIEHGSLAERAVCKRDGAR